MIYIKEKDKTAVVLMLDRAYRLGDIMEDGYGGHVFTDDLFASVHVLISDDLDALKTRIEEFYERMDTLGRIHDEFY